MEQMVQKLKINIICMEYPGYGIYQEYDSKSISGNKTQQRAQQILKDAETVYRFLRETCEVDESDMASRIHHPVSGVVIPMRWDEGQRGQVHGSGDEESGL